MMRRLLWLLPLLLVAAAFWFLSAGKDPENRAELHAVPLSDVAVHSFSSNRAVLALAFGGGGVRGFMHLGVIKALEEAGIRAELVTGTSAGSIAAALYASGKSYSEIEQLMRQLQRSDIVDLHLSVEGVIAGHALAEWIEKASGHTRIDTLPIPLGVSVTDLENPEPLFVTSGDLGDAVRTSSSVPGAFSPVESEGRFYVDGGVFSLVPVRLARAMGADIVIGIDILCTRFPYPQDDGIHAMLSTFRLQSCKIGTEEMAEADLLIRPDFEPESEISLASGDAGIEAGYLAMKAALPQLKALLQQAFK